jgi:hypothetical protein
MSYVVDPALAQRPRTDLPDLRLARLFRTFHGFPADRVRRAQHPRLVPRALVDLGRLCGVIYASDRGCRGTPRTFIHFMRSCPRLACDPAGRQLYIVGGRYRVTTRGIEG